MKIRACCARERVVTEVSKVRIPRKFCKCLPKETVSHPKKVFAQRHSVTSQESVCPKTHSASQASACPKTVSHPRQVLVQRNSVTSQEIVCPKTQCHIPGKCLSKDTVSHPTQGFAQRNTHIQADLNH
jgi:hypothetical protein